jgi:hypothetical protein
MPVPPAAGTAVVVRLAGQATPLVGRIAHADGGRAGVMLRRDAASDRAMQALIARLGAEAGPPRAA